MSLNYRDIHPYGWLRLETRIARLVQLVAARQEARKLSRPLPRQTFVQSLPVTPPFLLLAQRQRLVYSAHARSDKPTANRMAQWLKSYAQQRVPTRSTAAYLHEAGYQIIVLDSETTMLQAVPIHTQPPACTLFYPTLRRSSSIFARPPRPRFLLSLSLPLSVPTIRSMIIYHNNVGRRPT